MEWDELVALDPPAPWSGAAGEGGQEGRQGHNGAALLKALVRPSAKQCNPVDDTAL